MTPTEWRAVPENVARAKLALSHPTFAEMLEVIEADPPSNMPLPLTGLTPTDTAVAFGREQGYRWAIARLRAMGEEPTKPLAAVAATFAPETP